MRKHALLQDRLGETKTTRRPSIGNFDFDWGAPGRHGNLDPVIVRTDEAKSNGIGGHAFRHDGAEILATRDFRGGLLLGRRGMHWAAGGFGCGLLGTRSSSDGTVIRKGEPRPQRQNHDKRSNGAAPHMERRSRRLPDWQFVEEPLSRGMETERSNRSST